MRSQQADAVHSCRCCQYCLIQGWPRIPTHARKSYQRCCAMHQCSQLGELQPTHRRCTMPLSASGSCTPSPSALPSLQSNQMYIQGSSQQF